MSMVVNDHVNSMRTLSTFNKNDSALQKSIERVSTGQKVITAKDDATAYAISEKMRKQIRSLNQNSINVQNGSALMKIAADGIDDIISQLRSLKELAINSANDTNTDDDRTSLQKEYLQRIETINDIATRTSYNSKILLDGSFQFDSYLDETTTTVVENTKVRNLINGFSANGSQGSTASNSRIGLTLNVVSFSSSVVGRMDIDFSAMDTWGSSISEALDGQGFSILCGACEQFVNIKFDSSVSADLSTYDPNVANNMTVLNSEARQKSVQFNIGVAGVQNAGDLAKAIFDGIYALRNEVGGSSTATSAVVNSIHNLRINKDATDPSKYYFSKSGPSGDFFNGIIGYPSIYIENPLKIHHGTKANQATNFYINNMQTHRMDLDNVDLTTQKSSTHAITSLDKAINYALKQATSIGAYMQKLNHTYENILSMNDNTQEAESKFRDADLARETVNYARFNILTKASSSMLAQANQKPEDVKALLEK